MDATRPPCPECERHRARIVELERYVAQLEHLLHDAVRSGKRQSAPFSKGGPPKPNPKKPGRKAGDDYGQHAHRPPPPEAIDETL